MSAHSSPAVATYTDAHRGWQREREMAWLSLLVAVALIGWLMTLGRGALFEIRLAPGKVQV